MSKGYKSILCVSDMHCPYNHQDLVPFLKAAKNKFKPDHIVIMGDEVDHHALSFHEHDPDLFSAGEELLRAIDQLKPIYKLFPKAVILSSNHGDLAYRKAKHHGIPRAYLRSYGDILEAPKGWKWLNEYICKTSLGTQVYFHHGKSANAFKTSQAMSLSHVAGHYHNSFSINYWANPTGLYWALQTGSLVDDKSMAFQYNKCNLKRPIVGMGAIINGLPVLIPMVLDKHHRWIGRIL